MHHIRSQMIQLARKMLNHAVAPYSGFRVGAALWAGDEHLIGGCNVENASYGLSMCAERVAVYRWVAAGQPGSLQALAVCVDPEGPSPVRPCGACLQVVRQFAQDPLLYLIYGEQVEERRLSQLLPEPFTDDDLPG